MTTNIISNTPVEERNEWRTPQYIFDWADKLLGTIEYDTACTNRNAVAYPIWQMVKGMSESDVGCALSCAWFRTCWCNPPYDNIQPWIDKALASDAITAMLIPSGNGESRYEGLFAKSHEIQIVGRLAFLKPDGTPVSGNTRGSSLFIINGYGQGSRSFITRDEIFARFGK